VLVKATEEEVSQRELPDLVESTPHRKEMESVTEVNGSVARFEMAYSTASGKAVSFGPPLRQRLPSLLFLAFAAGVGLVVTVTYYGSSHSRLYAWMFEGQRALPAPVLALVIFLSALGTVLRAQMRGVVVHADGIEARYLLPMGVPRIRRWVWSQVERIVMDDESAMLELWDATYERLPDVARPRELNAMLGRIAAERRIVVTRLETLSDTRRRPHSA
jgi:hypothetical protein